MGGGDGGGLDDLLGYAVVGRLPLVVGHELDEITKQRKPIKLWKAWNHAWCHPIAVERRKQDKPKYEEFAKAGDLTIINEIGEDTEQYADLALRIYEG